MLVLLGTKTEKSLVVFFYFIVSFMLKALFSACLVTAVLGATSCQRHDEPTPIPVIPQATYSMASSVYYPTGNYSLGTSHSPLSLLGQARIRGGQLSLRFKSGDTAEDDVEFGMPANLTASKLGTYPCQSFPNPAAEAVRVTYLLTYQLNPTSNLSKLYRSSENLTEGRVVITAYDDRKQLISGTYSVEFKEAIDPYAELSPSRPAQKSLVSVSGDFNNVPIQ